MDWETVASVIVLAGLLWAGFSGGRSNPVSTSKLQRDVQDTKQKVSLLEQALKNKATKSDVEQLRGEIGGCATSDELHEVSEKVTMVGTKVEAMEKFVERTDEGVQRIERFFLEKGIKGQ